MYVGRQPETAVKAIKTQCARHEKAAALLRAHESRIGITPKFIRHMSSYRFIQNTTAQAVTIRHATARIIKAS
jgi:hypothetical protein